MTKKIEMFWLPYFILYYVSNKEDDQNSELSYMNNPIGNDFI
jgi:hypothetical protein